ncbi:40S ribosomal protein S19S-like [Panonychus citri]|uniref:40S ribosomal protein S19S-like n=1 Tax=Panonychus citri TaxID=50023 RepID=UPI0023071FD8|nr:40S ribosomal protein S19S-like [Panonychus citri]
MKLNAKVKSIGVKDVNQSVLVIEVAKFLKKSGKLPIPTKLDIDIVKTGLFKELAPFDPDWYYVRCAAIARHLYLRSPSGVGSLRRVFGGRYRRGVRPSHFCKASGTVLRKALQSLEALKWVEKDPVSGGRKLTSQGVRDLDRLSAQLKATTRSEVIL